MLAKLRGRPAHVNNRDCQNLEKILEVLYGGRVQLHTCSGAFFAYRGGRSLSSIATRSPAQLPLSSRSTTSQPKSAQVHRGAGP